MSEILKVPPEQYMVPTRAAWHHAPAVNTAAVVTFAATAGRRQLVYKPTWSYSDTPTAGQLTVASGGQVLHTWYITSGGPGFIPILVVGRLNQNLVITLTAAGAAVTGAVSVEKHWEKQG